MDQAGIYCSILHKIFDFNVIKYLCLVHICLMKWGIRIFSLSVPPKIVKAPVSQSIAVDDSARFECVATAKPEPTYFWYKVCHT